MTRGETHDTSPSRIPGSGRSRAASWTRRPPLPDPRAATAQVGRLGRAPPGARPGALAETRSPSRPRAPPSSATPRAVWRGRKLPRRKRFGRRSRRGRARCGGRGTSASASTKTRAPRRGDRLQSPRRRRRRTAPESASRALRRRARPRCPPWQARWRARRRRRERGGARPARVRPGPEKGARGDLPAWGAYGGGDAAPASAQRGLDLRGDPSSARARRDDGPPDRGAQRSVQEAEARAREAWGYYE